MPIKPKPHIIECPNCNWWIGNAPSGDALAPWEYFSECPKCGFKDLKIKPLSPLKVIILRSMGKMTGPHYLNK